MADINRAAFIDPDVFDAITDMMTYRTWNAEQIASGAKVRRAILNAVCVIVDSVPPGPDRSVAIRKLREVRMDADSAITHGGKY